MRERAPGGLVRAFTSALSSWRSRSSVLLDCSLLCPDDLPAAVAVSVTVRVPAVQLLALPEELAGDRRPVLRDGDVIREEDLDLGGGLEACVVDVPGRERPEVVLLGDGPPEG